MVDKAFNVLTCLMNLRRKSLNYSLVADYGTTIKQTMGQLPKICV